MESATNSNFNGEVVRSSDQFVSAARVMRSDHVYIRDNSKVQPPPPHYTSVDRLGHQFGISSSNFEMTFLYHESWFTLDTSSCQILETLFRYFYLI